MQFSFCDTLRKFHNFSVAQNLWEIDFGDSRSAKSTILTHLEALNCDFMNYCIFWRLRFTKLTIFRAPKIAKTPVLQILDSQKLLSRKNLSDRKIMTFPNILKFLHCVTKINTVKIQIMKNTHLLNLSKPKPPVRFL